jgi:hypothetical protein
VYANAYIIDVVMAQSLDGMEHIAIGVQCPLQYKREWRLHSG